MTAEPDPPDYNPEATWEQGGLASALRAFQAELPHIKKAAQSHHGKYADLAPVTHTILPKLAEHGLTWMCKPMLVDGQFVMRYKLTHTGTGQTEEGDYPLRTIDAQKQGSEITYARRYCLLAVTGVAPEGDDDDGHAAVQAKPQRKPRAEANGQLPKNAPGSAEPGHVTGVQMAYQKLGFKRSEREEMLHVSETIIGRALSGPKGDRTHNNLSHDEARKLRDTLDSFDGDRGDLLAKLVEAATP